LRLNVHGEQFAGYTLLFPGAAHTETTVEAFLTLQHWKLWALVSSQLRYTAFQQAFERRFNYARVLLEATLLRAVGFLVNFANGFVRAKQ